MTRSFRAIAAAITPPLLEFPARVTAVAEALDDGKRAYRSRDYDTHN